MTGSEKSVCEGKPFPPPEDSRCALCHLPMENHPITFVIARDHPDPYIRKLAGWPSA